MIKWALYGAATLAALLFQGFVLQFLLLWGVMPFLYPALTALVGMYEGPVAGSAYALVLGVACDLALGGPIPCFYTLIFPTAGLCAGLMAESWLPAGVLCALAASAAAFVLTDAFHLLILALTGQRAFGTAALVALKETGVTLPFVLPVFLLFRAVSRKCHFYD